MGVISALAGLRLHVLVVGVPGRPLLRLRAEAAVRARGWVVAISPADADVLLVAGDAPGELEEAFLRVWAQVPTPRARRTVRSAEDLTTALDSAARVVADDALQRDALLPGSGDPDRGSDRPDHSHDHMDMDMDHMDMDHMGMAMSGPGGIPLASGTEDDRDGLEMDVLHVPLGPVLPDWPAGLVVDCVLSGDVVLQAEARLLPGPDGPEEDPLPASARDLATGLDRAARLLRLSGADRPAARLTRILDRVLAGADPTGERRAIRAVAGALHRSALLHWSLGGERRARVVELLADCERWALGIGPVPAPIDPAALGPRLAGLTVDDARLRIADAGADPVPQGSLR